MFFFLFLFFSDMLINILFPNKLVLIHLYAAI